MLYVTRYIELIRIHAYGNPSYTYPNKPTPITLEQLKELAQYTDNLNHNLKRELEIRERMEESK